MDYSDPSTYNWSGGLQGAGGGALAGFGVGGPLGALVGGGIGLFGGLFGDSGQSGYQDQLKALSQGYGKRTAPQMGPASQAGYSGFRQNQAGLIAQLEAMARGEGPSAAQQQMRDAMDRASAAQASAAAGAGGRGVNSGAAMRQAMNNTAGIQMQGARDAATLRAQEQANAMGMLGQTIGQGRAADEGVNQFNAEANNRTALANLQAKLQMLGLNDEAQLKALLGAMGAAGPGMGTQLLAGGASAFPSLLAWRQAQQHAGTSAAGSPGGSPWPWQTSGWSGTGQGAITSPDQV